MSNLACWNIRGFNLTHKQKEEWDYVRKYDLEMVGILDTREQQVRIGNIIDNCVPRWCVEHNYLYNSSGKIWVCWKPTIGIVRCIDKCEQSVTLEVQKGNGLVFLITMVYASIDGSQRRNLWDNIVRLSCNINVPWMLLGILILY